MGIYWKLLKLKQTEAMTVRLDLKEEAAQPLAGALQSWLAWKVGEVRAGAWNQGTPAEEGSPIVSLRL